MIPSKTTLSLQASYVTETKTNVLTFVNPSRTQMVVSLKNHLNASGAKDADN